MTVAEARELFAYNDWANRRLFEALVRLPEEQLGEVPPGTDLILYLLEKD
jgi:uncharacterized damage-inducible protein DinB